MFAVASVTQKKASAKANKLQLLEFKLSQSYSMGIVAGAKEQLDVLIIYVHQHCKHLRDCEILCQNSVITIYYYYICVAHINMVQNRHKESNKEKQKRQHISTIKEGKHYLSQQKRVL